MLVIVGLVVLLVAVIVGFTAVLTNAGPTHPLTENFSVLGYHVTGSTGTLFLSGIVIGAAAMLGLSVLLAGVRRTARRGRDTRHELENSQRQTESRNRDRDQRLERQLRGAATSSPVNPQAATTGRDRVPLLGRWSSGRQPTASAHVDSPARQPTRSILSARNRGLSSPKTKESANEHR
jgi:hypothetical protein